MQKLQQTCHSFPFKGQVITMGRPDLALHLLIPIVEYIDYHISEKWISKIEMNKFISSSWGNSKMYKSGSIASSQRMPTDMNESDGIAKIRISVESDTVKHL